MNKKWTYKILSTFIAIVILCGAANTCIYMATTSNNKSEEIPATQKNENTIPVRVTKDETVYIIASADGTAKKIIVSGWLSNTEQATFLTDDSELQDIKNVKGEQSYTIDQDGMRIWDAQGQDIYFQGECDKILPVELQVSYYLDGDGISPDELAGKSGELTIQFTYKNNRQSQVMIHGKNETIFAPYLMLTGLVFDNHKVTDVKISNGKIINDGEKTFVAGFALPGVKESLGLDKNNFDIPDTIKITANVKDFSLTTTMTLAINDIFSNLHIDKDAELAGLTNALNQLGNATNALTDGSSSLYNGLKTLADKSEQLISGINTLVDGAKQLSKGAEDLSIGSLDLKDGTKQLSDGLSQLNQNSSTLVTGAETVFDTLLATANEQIAASGITAEPLTRNNYAQVIEKLLESMNDDNIQDLAYHTALQKVTQQVQANKNQIVQSVEDAVLEQMLSAAGQSMKANDYRAALDAGFIPDELKNLIEVQMQSDTVVALMKQNVSTQMNNLIEQYMSDESIQQQIKDATQTAITARNSLITLKQQLDSYDRFYTGLKTYTTGVDNAYEGSKELSTGSDKLSIGASSLYEGIKVLQDGLHTLKEGCLPLSQGVDQLNNGAKELSDGLQEFKKNGIQKIIDLFDGDVESLIERINALSDAAKKESSYAGSSSVNGTVKYIYRTDSIE